MMRQGMVAGLAIATVMFTAVFGQIDPAESTLPTEQLLPLAERRHTFRIIEGDGAGEQVQQTLRPAQEQEGEPGQWVLELGDLNRLYLRRNEAGDVEAVRLDLPQENRAVVYDPPVVMIPARVEAELAGATTSRARVYDLESGELTHTGQVTHEIKQVSRSRFDTAVGTQQGYLIVIDHEVDLDLGNATLGLETGYVPGEGMVYRHMRYTIEKLGFFGDTTRRTAVLAERFDAADQRGEGE